MTTTLEIMNVTNETAAILTKSADKMNKVLDLLNSFNSVLSYFSKFYKDMLHVLNTDIAKDKNHPPLLPSVEWQYSRTDLAQAAASSMYNIAWSASNGKLKDGRLDAVRIPIGSANDLMKQFGILVNFDVPSEREELNVLPERANFVRINREALDAMLRYVSKSLAVVVFEDGKSSSGSAYEIFKDALYDSTKIDGAQSGLNTKVRAVSELSSQLPNKVSLLQTTVQNLQRNLDSLMTIMNQLMGRL
jgi:hypothetical protein